MKCPNCGTQVPSPNGTCICCWWTEGEPYFRPHWMDDKTWREGMAAGWLSPKKKKKEEYEMPQAIRESLGLL